MAEDLVDLFEIAVEHIPIVERQWNEAVLDFAMNLVLLLQNEDHDEVDPEHRLLEFCRDGLRYASQVKDQGALFDEESHVNELVPIFQRNKTVCFQALLLRRKVGHYHKHHGINDYLIKRSGAQFASSSLLFKQINNRVKRVDNNQLKQERIEDELIIHVSLDYSSFSVRMLLYDNLVRFDVSDRVCIAQNCIELVLRNS